MEHLEHTDYSLANLAGVSMPDNHDSPGAKFLLGIQDAVNEALDWAKEHDEDFESSAMAHDIADAAVPIYTYEKWQTFVDLAAWQEDISEFGTSEDSDMDDMSNLALYGIARRLAEVLFEEANADDTEEEGES